MHTEKPYHDINHIEYHPVGYIRPTVRETAIKKILEPSPSPYFFGHGITLTSINVYKYTFIHRISDIYNIIKIILVHGRN